MTEANKKRLERIFFTVGSPCLIAMLLVGGLTAPGIFSTSLPQWARWSILLFAHTLWLEIMIIGIALFALIFFEAAFCFRWLDQSMFWIRRHRRDMLYLFLLEYLAIMLELLFVYAAA